MPAPVSVLIPAYNSADLLPETLDTILSQTLPPAEVLVVDDGSSENMSGAVARFGGRVGYHFIPNGGICRARNTAASLATQPYLAFCDHDDLWRPDKLEQQMALHARNPALRYSFTNFALVVDGVWAGRTKLDDAPDDFFSPALPPGTDAVEFSGSLYRSLLRFQPIWPSTVIIAREFFEEMGGFREEFGRNPSEDLEFTLRCVRRGPMGVVREPVVGVRRHAENYSASNERNTRGQIEILRYVLEHHGLDAEESALVVQEIERRRVEASYGAFQRGDFNVVRELLAGVPAGYMDSKTRMKGLVARLPESLARRVHGLLVRGE